MAFTDRQAAFAYINDYQRAKYDRVTVMAPKGQKEVWQTAAKAKGLSLSAFVQQCVDACLL